MRHFLRMSLGALFAAWIGGASAADLGTIAITTALTNSASTPITGLGKMQSVSLIATFTYVSGGTTAKIYVQTSCDSGSSWYDIGQFAFTTAGAVKFKSLISSSAVTTASLTTGTMADDTAQQGLLCDRLRFAVTSTGTYAAGAQINVRYQAH